MKRQSAVICKPMEHILFYRLTTDEMFLNNAIEYGFVDVVIPDSIGVDDKQRTVVTDT